MLIPIFDILDSKNWIDPIEPYGRCHYHNLVLDKTYPRVRKLQSYVGNSQVHRLRDENRARMNPLL
jgi:hypothetical protein